MRVRGLPLSTSAKFSDFWTPSPPCPHFCKTVCPQNQPIFGPLSPLGADADVLNGSPLSCNSPLHFISFVHGVDDVLVFLHDEEALQLQRGAQLAAGHRELGREDGELLHLGRVRDCPRVRPLDSRVDGVQQVLLLVAV